VEDPRLRELLDTPLMLRVMLRAQRGAPAALPTGHSLEERRRRLFDIYIHSMLEHRHQSPYLASAIKWLTCLADALTRCKRTEFRLDEVDSCWLPTRRQRLAVAIISTTLIAVVCGLATGLLMKWLLGLSHHWSVRLDGWKLPSSVSAQQRLAIHLSTVVLIALLVMVAYGWARRTLFLFAWIRAKRQDPEVRYGWPSLLRDVIRIAGTALRRLLAMFVLFQLGKGVVVTWASSPLTAWIPLAYRNFYQQLTPDNLQGIANAAQTLRGALGGWPAAAFVVLFALFGPAGRLLLFASRQLTRWAQSEPQLDPRTAVEVGIVGRLTFWLMNLPTRLEHRLNEFSEQLDNAFAQRLKEFDGRLESELAQREAAFVHWTEHARQLRGGTDHNGDADADLPERTRSQFIELGWHSVKLGWQFIAQGWQFVRSTLPPVRQSWLASRQNPEPPSIEELDNTSIVGWRVLSFDLVAMTVLGCTLAGFIAGRASIPLESIWLALGLLGVWTIVRRIRTDRLEPVSSRLGHLIIRAATWRSGRGPLRYRPFLTDMTDRLLLKKVGSSYSFYHGLLLEHFAASTPAQPEESR